MSDPTPDTTDEARALTVACPDCMAPPGVSCGDQPHADRVRDADLAALEHGTCALCGRFMVRGTVAGSDPDAWHPEPDDAALCPPIPDASTDWNRYAAAVNLGLTPGHPGAEHFLPDPPSGPLCPECVAGKHANCDGQAWDPVADAPAPCACADRDAHTFTLAGERVL